MPPKTSEPRGFDKDKIARGKLVFAAFVNGKLPDKVLPLADATLSDMCAYLDRQIFTLPGTGKFVRAVRKEAKRRGVL